MFLANLACIFHGGTVESGQYGHRSRDLIFEAQLIVMANTVVNGAQV